LKHCANGDGEMETWPEVAMQCSASGWNDVTWHRLGLLSCPFSKKKVKKVDIRWLL
jgi:hypothetical protein